MQSKRMWQQRRARIGFRGEVPVQRSFYACPQVRRDERWLERSVLAGALVASIGLHVALTEVPPPPRKAPVLVQRQPVRLNMPVIEEETKLEPPPEPSHEVFSKAIGSGAVVENKQATSQQHADNRRRMEEDRNLAGSSGALGAFADNKAVETVFSADKLAQELDDLTEGMVMASNENSGQAGMGFRGAGEGGTGGTIGIGPLGTKGFHGGKGGYNPIGGPDTGRKQPHMIDIKSNGGEVSPGYDRSLVSRTINKHLSSIRYCYQKQLNRDPSLYGKVTVQFTINGEGLVSVALVKATTMKSAEVESCVVGIVKHIAFPEPKGGGIVQVSYPFLFSSAGSSAMN